jgi:hypothetical protein
VTGVTSAATSTTSVSISWSENLDYRVTGYKVYYRFTTSGTYSFHGNVIGTTSTVISGLTATAEPPLKPVMDPPAPRDRALVLSWTTDTLATNYNIHYSLESAPTLTTTISHVGNVNTYTLTNLTNYERYWISVTPVAQPTLYSVVTSSYDITAAAAVGPGSGFESDYSAPSLAYFGDMVTGPTSTTVLGIPEPTVPFPTLPNTGCFIATAAYGGQDALPVRVLREFRDRRLLTTSAGRSFVAWYYRTSPALAAWLNGHPALKPLVRAALEPVVIAAALLTHVPALLLFAGAAGLLPLLRRTTRRRPS